MQRYLYMNAEKDYIYEIDIEVSELNEDNFLKPYAYQNIFAKVAEQHLTKINLNVDETMKYHLAWVLMSISLEIVKPVEGCQKLYAKTWYSQRKGPFFRRELSFNNSKGELVFHGSTYSVLLDLESRTIYRRKEIPFIMHKPIEDFTIDAAPSFKSSLEYCKIDERRVYNSFIDCLGHVNNTRYGEFAYDALTENERQNLRNMKRFDIYFLSELRNNDTFSVLKAYEGNKILVQGINNEKMNISFNVVFEFLQWYVSRETLVRRFLW